MNERTVVLGGNGFIGRALVQRLADLGAAVVSVSRHLPLSTVDGVEHVNCSYDNWQRLAAHYADATRIVHLAWDTTPSLSAGQPALELNSNLHPLARLLELLPQVSDARLIFASTGGAIYGDITDDAAPPLTENAPVNPRSYYAAAKGASELMLQAFNQQSGAAVSVLRPSNVYGPGQRSQGHFAVIPTLLSALRSGDSFTIRGDGTAERDYLYIDDFVDLLLAIVERSGGPGFERYNAAAGRSISLNRLVVEAERVTGRSASLTHGSAGRADVHRVALSAHSVCEALRWKPNTPIAEGLQRTWDWMLRDG